MLLLRWHQFGDRPSSFPRPMDTQLQLFGGSGMSLAAHHIGLINFSGVWRTRCRSLLSMVGAWSFALASEREDNSKTPWRKSRKTLSSNLWRTKNLSPFPFPLPPSPFPLVSVEIWTRSMLDLNVSSFFLLWWPFSIFLKYILPVKGKKNKDNGCAPFDSSYPGNLL